MTWPLLLANQDARIQSHDLTTLTDQSECLNSVTWPDHSYWPIRMLEFSHMTWPLLLTNQDAWIQSHDPPSVSTWAIVWRRHSVGHTEYSCPRCHRKHHSLPEHEEGRERLIMMVWVWSKFIGCISSLCTHHLHTILRLLRFTGIYQICNWASFPVTFLVYSCILLYTTVYSCILQYTPAYSCILLHTLEYYCILLHTTVYSCILLYTPV